MNYIRIQFKNQIQKIVDLVHGKPVDIVTLIGFIILLIFTVDIINIIINTAIADIPVVPKVYNNMIYSFIIALPITLFYLSLAGNFFQKPYRRIQVFVFTVVVTSIFAVGYILQISNLSFINWLYGIEGIEGIPNSLLMGDIRAVSFLFPTIAVTPIIVIIGKILSNKEARKYIRNLEIDVMLPTVYKLEDTAIDIKICKDHETGENCIVPEKKLYESTLLQGSSGSGKSSLYIENIIEQLYRKKAYLREIIKKEAYECIENGVAYLKKPVSNKGFNKYFSTDYIEPMPEKRKEYIENMNKYIIGVRSKNQVIKEEIIKNGNIILNGLGKDEKYVINIVIEKNGMEVTSTTTDITNRDTSKNILLEESFKPVIVTFKDKNSTTQESTIISENNDEIVEIFFSPLPPEHQYKIHVSIEGSGKIIYKDTGICVIAPDGGLPQKVMEIAQSYNVKTYKIDPSMEEIRKGHIAKFNPLKGGRPDKVGDIISSILISMDNEGDKKGNPYFTNASVRAVRNLVILLKEMYPVKYGGKDPTLRDVLDCLNDFNLVIPLCEAMKEDEAKRKKWGSVLNYFSTCFYPIPQDNNGREQLGTAVGSQRKKTQEAISGIINQLDNFITREEVAYILCDRDQSIDLYTAIENGECIAIATRQNELGERLGKAFALFFILSIQNVVLSRYTEIENPEKPFHLIIDEFPMYINDSTKLFFTFARKYKCATTIAIQNMAQLLEISNPFREIIFTNTNTKILLPNSNYEDRRYWSGYLGTYTSFTEETGVTVNSIFNDKPKYTEQHKGTLKETKNFSEQDINDLLFKEAIYSFTDKKGRQRVGKGIMEFMEIEKKNIPECKDYDFEKFNIIPDNNKKRKKEINKNSEMEDELLILGDIIIDETNKETEAMAIEDIHTVNNIQDMSLEDMYCETQESVDLSNSIEDMQYTDEVISEDDENDAPKFEEEKILDDSEILDLNFEDIEYSIEGDK